MRRIVLVSTGLLLVIAAVVALVRGGVPYEDSETLLDVGDIELSASSEEEFHVPPLVAGLALIAGGALVFAGARSNR